MKSASCLALFLASALTFSSLRVHANGRYPEASQLIVDPKDSNRIVLRATFGMIHSPNAFVPKPTWSWVCESALGYTGTYDPAIAVSGDSSLFVGLPDGIGVSTDQGCSFPKSSSALNNKFVIDLAIDTATPSRIVAIAALEDTSMGKQTTMVESKDNGKTWSNAKSLPEDFRPETIEVAPSRAQRLYASGKGPFAQFGVLVKSDDNGETWQDFYFDLKGGLAPFISGVDPLNHDRIYIRVTSFSGDTLYWFDASDGKLHSIFTASGKLLGFAASKDGKKIAFGGPQDGLYIADTTEFNAAKISELGVRCLTWTAQGLFACADENFDGFTVGVSSDEGKTFKPLFHRNDLQLANCPSSTPNAQKCPAQWSALQSLLNPPKDAGTDAETAVDATSDTTLPVVDAASEGSPDSSPDVFDSTPSDIGFVQPDKPNNQSCSCRLIGQKMPFNQSFKFLGLLGFVGILCRSRNHHRRL